MFRKGPLTKKIFLFSIAISLLVFLLGFYLAAFWGEPKIHLSSILSGSGIDYDILIQARLPRIFIGILVGMVLSLVGASFQAILRNPLADPFILGVSSGAALGGALGLCLNLAFVYTLGLAFLSGIFSIFLIYQLSKARGELPVHSLLLTGVIFNSFVFALILLMNSLVSIGTSQQILFLMIGSIDSMSWDKVILVGVIVLPLVIYICSKSQSLNVMTLGDEPAIHLGVNPHQLRKKIFIIGSIMVAGVVTIAGLIGFVGLIIPHLLRMVVGPDHRILLPLSAIIGAVFMVVCDWTAKNILFWFDWGGGIPVGVVTALIGGPVFIFLLKRSYKMI